jgi:hypothetical protein
MMNILEAIQANNTDTIDIKPFAQVFVGNASTQKGVGVFISDEQGEKAGFVPTEGSGWIKHKHVFKNADEFTEGVINASPRMVLLTASSLGMFSKETGKYERDYNDDIYKGYDGMPLSWFDKPENQNRIKTYPNKNKYDLKTKYMVFFLGKDNEFLHEIPMQLTLKGVAGGSFGGKLKEFKQNFCTVTKKNRDLRSSFWVQCVFQPVFKSELFQFTGGSATVAKVTGFTPLTADNLEQQLERVYLYQPEVEKRLKDARESLADYGWVKEIQIPIEEPTPQTKAPEASPEGSALLNHIRNSIIPDDIKYSDNDIVYGKSETLAPEDESDIPF